MQRVAFDLETKRLSDDSKNIPLAAELSRIITDDDWLLLENYFRSYKAKRSEDFDPESVDVAFPTEEIERDGLLTNYGDVLPFSEIFTIDLNNSKYQVIDKYCLNPHHPCKEFELEFIPTSQSLEEYDRFGATRLRISGDQGLIGVGVQSLDPSSPTPSQFFSTVEQKADILRRCKHRHIILRALYRKWRAQSAPPTRPIRVEPKPGRNDQCFCGSGKKYKKCCLN
ncbi:MAG: SEC-C metal-binding domain-containing protein [Proteobacteria bacterium]|nr:SEC-C metal-binding domain-containing protein [Pseudomonadota bacterium]